MTNFAWKIVQLVAIPEADGLENVVSRIVGTLTATAEDGVMAARLVNAQAGPYDTADFTPFEELTQEVVVSWLEACIGEAGMTQLKAGLEVNIIEMRNLSLPPPWETTVPL